MSLEAAAELVLDPGIPPIAIYVILFFGCVAESLFPPWPADLVTLYTGFLAGRGVLTPTMVFVVAVSGTQTGVMGMFWLFRHWGRAVLAGRLGRHLPFERLQRLDRWFARYGAPAIAFSRFLPGIRALVVPAAGLAGFSAWKVWIWAGTSVLLWNVFIVGLGLAAGRELDWARRMFFRYNATAITVVVALLATVVLWRLLRRKPQG